MKYLTLLFPVYIVLMGAGCWLILIVGETI